MRRFLDNLKVGWQNFRDMCRIVNSIEVKGCGGAWWILFTSPEELSKQIEDAMEEVLGPEAT